MAQQPRAQPSADLIVAGRVQTQAGAVSGAEVRVRGQRAAVRTDDAGRFQLPVTNQEPQSLAVWKRGFYIAEATGAPTANERVQISLTPLPPPAGTSYQWVSAHGGDEESCVHCHGEIVDEWRASGHAHAANNRRFLNLYEGSNWQNEPGHGWSLLDDYPEGASVCAACHVPTLDAEHVLLGDVRGAAGVAAEGVHCDFCHKVQDVTHDGIGLAHGRLGMDLLLPAEGQVFFGPLKDATRGKEAFAPIYQESHYCAACHEGVVFGVHVYSTYSEWLASPARQRGETCQSCHMAPTGTLTNFAPDAGGVPRNPQTLASHSLLPGGRAAMLQRAVRVSPRAIRDPEGCRLEIRLLAHDVGHKVPTGFIDRHLLLVVDPLDAQRQPLHSETVVREGPRLATPAGRQWAGKPGLLFGRWLRDQEGNEPVPFWRVAEEVQDSRLIPDQPVIIRFALSDQAKYARVRLLYRRFWQVVAEDKGWPDETIVVYEETISL